jgi:hypothetical protein
MTTNDNRNEARLNALMNSWQAPNLPPGFSGRVSARIMEQQRKREPIFPWSPAKLVAATAIAAVVGILLGVTMPATYAVADAPDSIIEELW